MYGEKVPALGNAVSSVEILDSIRGFLKLGPIMTLTPKSRTTALATQNLVVRMSGYQTAISGRVYL